MISVRFSQYSKALLPITLKDSGKMIPAKPVQPLKVPYPLYPSDIVPIEITELGIVISVNSVQLVKAQSPRTTTLLGITVPLQPAINVWVAVSTMPLQLSRESYIWFPGSTIMLVSLLQLLKAPFSIIVTELGIVSDWIFDPSIMPRGTSSTFSPIMNCSMLLRSAIIS